MATYGTEQGGYYGGGGGGGLQPPAGGNPYAYQPQPTTSYPPPQGQYPPPQGQYLPDQQWAPSSPPPKEFGAPGGGEYYEESPLQQPAEKFQPASGYRDFAFYIAFVVHLLAAGAIFGIGWFTFASGKGADNSEGKIINEDDLDKTTTFHIFLTAAVCAAVAALSAGLWLVMFKYFARQLIYLSIGFSVLFTAAIAVFSFIYGNIWAGVIFAIFAVISALFFWLWRSRIPFAVEMLKTVSVLVQNYPGTTTVAFASLILQFGWFVFWSVAIFLVQQYTPVLAYVLSIYLLFSFYWVSQVIKNVVHVTAAGVFASWYFLHGTVGVPPNPTLGSFKRATTTSFGSICFGSLIVALLRTLRMIFRSFRQNSDNIAIVILAFIGECIVACLDQLLEYFNQYAYAQIAIYGKSYCRAAKDTWHLVHSHGIQAIINDNIIGSVLSMACLASAVVTGVLGGAMIYALEDDYYIPVGIICGLIGFVMVMQVLEIVESAVTTIFVCFAEEPEALQRNSPELYHKFQTTYGNICDFLV